MKLISVIIAFSFCFSMKAQVNLVPNSSFEFYTYCPDAIGQLDKATGWINPNEGSPDYFNKCQSIVGPNIPLNSFGVQYPKEGNAYAGIYTFNEVFPNSSEYLQIKLAEPLITDKKYCVEFYVSLADLASSASMNKIGAYFSNNKISQSDWFRFQVSPQILNPTSNSLFDTLGWVKVSGEFKADGGEEYITIGNFNLPGQDDTTYIGGGFPGSGNQRVCYFYIDNVSVYSCEAADLNGTYVITPNNDGINDHFEIPFNSKKGNLLIYDRMGRLVYKGSNYQNNWSGLGVSDGLYYYILETTDKETIKGSITILR